jgi:hypothetical protein
MFRALSLIIRSSWTVYAAYGTGELIYVFIGSYKIIVYGIWSMSYRYVSYQ